MSTGLAVVLGVIVGLVAGASAVWAVLSRRLANEKVKRERLTGDIAERDLELARTGAA